MTPKLYKKISKRHLLCADKGYCWIGFKPEKIKTGYYYHYHAVVVKVIKQIKGRVTLKVVWLNPSQPTCYGIGSIIETRTTELLDWKAKKIKPIKLVPFEPYTPQKGSFEYELRELRERWNELVQAILNSFPIKQIKKVMEWFIDAVAEAQEANKKHKELEKAMGGIVERAGNFLPEEGYTIPKEKYYKLVREAIKDGRLKLTKDSALLKELLEYEKGEAEKEMKEYGTGENNG